MEDFAAADAKDQIQEALFNALEELVETGALILDGMGAEDLSSELADEVYDVLKDLDPKALGFEEEEEQP